MTKDGKFEGAIKKTNKKIDVLETNSYSKRGNQIKWQYHEIDTIIAIHGEMEEKFAKLVKK
jgi:hypothetical protein